MEGPLCNSITNPDGLGDYTLLDDSITWDVL